MGLDAQLLEAHAQGDKRRLAALYERAADEAPSVDATCFFLTQAYVFALDAGDARATALHARLKQHGREA